MLESKKLLLFDSIGALVSAMCLGVLIPTFNGFFNVPVETLNLLASIASVFFLYSLASYFFSGDNWRVFLRIIAIANLSYCVLTAALIFKHFDSISDLAIVYFLGEIVLVVASATWELKVASQK